MIKLRFVTANDLVSAGIRAYQYGFWASHVEALIDGKLVGAHFRGGVAVRDMGYDAGPGMREEYMQITAADEIAKKFEAFMMAQVGKPYDVEAIGAMVLERDWRDPNSWFCSELVTAALEACLLLNRMSVSVNRITPRDAYIISNTLS